MARYFQDELFHSRVTMLLPPCIYAAYLDSDFESDDYDNDSEDDGDDDDDDDGDDDDGDDDGWDGDDDDDGCDSDDDVDDGDDDGWDGDDAGCDSDDDDDGGWEGDDDGCDGDDDDDDYQRLHHGISCCFSCPSYIVCCVWTSFKFEVRELSITHRRVRQHYARSRARTNSVL